MGRSLTANSGTKVAVLLEMNRYGSFPLLSEPPLSLTSEQTLKDLKRSQGHKLGGGMDLANWALRASPKFNKGVKYQFHQGF